MKISNTSLMVKWFFCGGLLIVVITSWISRHVVIPDFWHGMLIGVGIALEIIGAVKMIQLKRSGTC